MAVWVQRVSWETYSKHWWKSVGRWMYGAVSFMGTPSPLAGVFCGKRGAKGKARLVAGPAYLTL
jgi:hypothetical protein